MRDNGPRYMILAHDNNAGHYHSTHYAETWQQAHTLFCALVKQHNAEHVAIYDLARRGKLLATGSNPPSMRHAS